MPPYRIAGRGAGDAGATRIEFGRTKLDGRGAGHRVGAVGVKVFLPSKANDVKSFIFMVPRCSSWHVRTPAPWAFSEGAKCAARGRHLLQRAAFFDLPNIR